MAPRRSRRRIRSGDAAVLTDKSSSSESEKTERSSTLRRSRRVQHVKDSESSSSSSSVDSAYDGDGETTCSTRDITSPSDPATSSPGSMYDFDDHALAPHRVVLSPKQPKVKKKTVKLPKSSKISASSVEKVIGWKKCNKTKKMAAPVTRQYVTPIIAKSKLDCENRPIKKPKGMKTPGVSPILSCTLDSSVGKSVSNKNKRKMSNNSNNTPVYATKSKIQRTVKNDSGFLSPPLRKVPRPAAKDTSTPSNAGGVATVQGGDACFGFDSTASPVSQMVTSDYGSAVLDFSQISMNDSVICAQKDVEVTMFSEPEVPAPDLPVNKNLTSSYKASKQKRPKGRYSTSKLEAWADRMNQEIDDANNFELSIEG